jgi:2-polyprenyl-3-methyl-5-hydroxy-6-metoxy-1,4-benzoquinol methylase
MQSCESCGSSKVTLTRIRHGLSYWCCRGCRHCLIDSSDGLEAEFENAQNHYFGEDSILLQKEPSIFEREILVERMRLINAHTPPSSSVVEVGPGSGFLAGLLKAQGHRVRLVEHSHNLGAALRRRLDVPVHNGEFENAKLPKGAADVFCSFHVIEHIKDPLAHLKAGFAAVSPGGIGIVATPNASSWQQILCRALSPNFDSAHLRVFSTTSLKRYAELAGWAVQSQFTLDYTSDWLRVLTKALRKFKGEDEEATAGKYAITTMHVSVIYKIAAFTTAPLRRWQGRLGGGNEICIVLQRPKK